MQVISRPCFGLRTFLLHYSMARRAPPTKGTPWVGGHGPGPTGPLAVFPLTSAGTHACLVLPEPAVGLDCPQL